MKVALVNMMVPYVRGGAEIIAEDLEEQLHVFGHDARLFRIPMPPGCDLKMLDTVLTARMLNFDEYDRVIAFKFPAYCVRHPAKVIWLFHQFRQAYELAAETPEVHWTLDRIRAADNQYISQARHIFTIAGESHDRLKRYNGIESEILRTPLKNAGSFYCGKTGDYIFCASRMDRIKRQNLAVQAMKYTKSGVKLVIAGQCPDRGMMEEMRAYVQENQLEKKVVIRDEWITEQEKIEYMANSLGAIYIPYKEDSSGIVTMEAQYSRKPVITCVDSGGTNEFVENGKTGFVTQPAPESLAEAMDRLYEDRRLAERMGETGNREIVERKMTWEHTIGRLLK